jgi:hypothetical protein
VIVVAATGRTMVVALRGRPWRKTMESKNKDGDHRDDGAILGSEAPW